jgi:hypothetical protein
MDVSPRPTRLSLDPKRTLGRIEIPRLATVLIRTLSGQVRLDDPTSLGHLSPADQRGFSLEYLANTWPT